ncbi:MAG: hypothetical protein KDI09_11885 [Halioglobus sp.]|nr:hypothetical protein [Halioglobus sp.]
MPASTFLRIWVAALLLTVASGCGKKPDDAKALGDSSLLEYVAADTPYLFGILQPMPQELADKLEPRIDKLLQGYQLLIRSAVQDGTENAEATDDTEEGDEQAAALDKVTSLLSIDGLREAGMGRGSTFVLYGAGILPVLRINATDGDAFEKTFAEIEADAGSQMPTAKIDDLEYRYAGDEKAKVILARMGRQIVLTLVPTGISDEALREALGLTLPKSSIAGSGKLQQISKDYGFTAHGIGFMDAQRIADVFLQDASGLNAELLELAGYDNSKLSEVCKAEFASLAGVAPLLVTGYTELNVDRIASTLVLELRKDIADGLATLTAPVAGLGTDQGGLVSMGMSIDLLALRAFYEARLDAMEKDPYACELLQDFQAGIARGRAILQQPVPPVAYSLKGFLAVVDDMQGMNIAAKQAPTSIDMRFLLATDNAAGLLAMGSMFSPELAALNLKADGKPVRFQSPMLQAPVDEAWLAMNDSALAMSVGAGGEKKLSAMLSAKAGDPPPFYAMQMDAERYYSIVSDISAQQQDDEVPPAVAQATADIMQSLSGLFDRMSVTVNFTNRGAEVGSVVTLVE